MEKDQITSGKILKYESVAIVSWQEHPEYIGISVHYKDVEEPEVLLFPLDQARIIGQSLIDLANKATQ